MRLLVDECVDWRLLRDLAEHEVKTVKQLGWEHYDDGDLLQHAAVEFECISYRRQGPALPAQSQEI